MTLAVEPNTLVEDPSNSLMNPVLGRAPSPQLSFCDVPNDTQGHFDNHPSNHCRPPVYHQEQIFALHASIMAYVLFLVLCAGTNSSHTMTTHLARVPSEIIPLILDEVGSRSVLYHLLFVSKTFNYWAERSLYRNLDVGPHLAENYVSQAFFTIAKCPRIALHVHSVGIFGHRIPQSIPWATAFQSMNNLKSLAIFVTSPFLSAIEPDSGFQLRSFVYIGNREVVANQWLSVFLKTQSSLEKLHLCDLFTTRSASSIALSTESLPKLVKLYAHLDDARIILPGRFITHLGTYSASRGHAKCIEGASSVRSLRITNAESLPLYRGAFPSLELLEFTMEDYSSMFKRIFPYLEKMPVLQKIKAGIPEKSQSAYVVWAPKGHSPPAIAQTFSACSSLQAIEICEGRRPIEGLQSKVWTPNCGFLMDTRWNDAEWLDY